MGEGVSIQAAEGGSFKSAKGVWGAKDGAWVEVPLGSPDTGWTRPADWLPTNVVAGEQKIQCLLAVGADPTVEANRVMSLALIGAYTVDWGDGTALQNYASNTVAQHVYDPASLTATSEGWKQAMVTITAQGGQSLTTINLTNAYYAGKTWRSPVVEIVVGSSLLTALTLTGACPLLRRVEFKQPFTSTAPASQFINCYNLREVVGEMIFPGVALSAVFSGCSNMTKFPTLTLTSSATNINVSSFFSLCSLMVDVPLFNLTNGGKINTWTSTYSGCFSIRSMPAGFTITGGVITTAMFQSCYALETLPTLDTSAVTQAGSMFLNCYALRAISLNSTAALTLATSMFSGCAALESISDLDFSNVSSANLATVFASCSRLSRLKFLAGKAPAFTWTVVGMIDAAGLDAIYTASPTVSGQTITVTGLPGTLADNPTIATAKGWTVTGS